MEITLEALIGALGVIVTIIFAANGITNQRLNSLQERLEQEALRLKDNTDKAEKRLDDSTSKAEERLKEETAKAETRLAESLAVAEHRRQEQIAALDDKINIRLEGLGNGLRAEMTLQFTEIRRQIEKLNGGKPL